MKIIIHKQNSPSASPKVSIILLDWSVRESFHTLDWLWKQDVPRDQYELIWVELHERVEPVVREKADVVITCGQTGLYHKHIGYNIGLLHAKGQIVTVCDSDAVFPPDFVTSVLSSFKLMESGAPPHSIVLMHHEWRTKHLYPENLTDINQLSQYKWNDLWPNVGACMSVLKAEAIRLGGFDEHSSFRGYICGPYDLGWRMVNAGIPEIWHEEQVALWHFAHPHAGQPVNKLRWGQITYPHLELHALTAVEAFSTGRLLPLKENPEIHQLRLSQRRIGTPLEEKYAWMISSDGSLRWGKWRLYLQAFWYSYIWLHFRRAYQKLQLMGVLKS